MSDERAAAVLRVLENDLPPSTVDIDRAVRAGRRRERTRRALAAGALAGVTALAGVGAVAVLGDTEKRPAEQRPAEQPKAQVCANAALPGASGEARAISPSGKYVAAGTDRPGPPLLWADGAPVVVTVPAGVTATPDAVNDRGVIVGIARHDDRTVPFIIRDGAYAELPLPAGAEGAARGINGQGDVVGWTWVGQDRSNAVVWRGGGAVTTLAADATHASAFAIADDGTAFGSLEDGGVPYSWGPDGTGRALADRGKAFGVAGDYVYGYNGVQAAGRQPGADQKAKEGSGQANWVRWQLSTGAVVEVKGLFPNDVDTTGTIVGSVQKGGKTVPARWRDGTVAELPGGVGEVYSSSRDGSRLAGWTGDVNAPTPTLWSCA